jgi:hypothetical protein
MWPIKTWASIHFDLVYVPGFLRVLYVAFSCWFTLTGSDLRGRPLKVYLSNQGDHGELPHNSCAMLYPAHASTEEAEP